VFPLRVLRPGAHFGETPRARQPSGHLCDRLPFPLSAACGRMTRQAARSRKPRRAPVTRRRANGDLLPEHAPPGPACRPGVAARCWMLDRPPTTERCLGDTRTQA